MELINNYSYLCQIAHGILDPKMKLMDEYHLSGSRYSGKTISIDIAIAMSIITALYVDKKIAVYAFRKMNKDAGQLNSDLRNVLESFGLEEGVHFKLARPMQSYVYTFSNGSFIVVRGVHTQQSSHIALKGLASCMDFDLCIKGREEANEFTLHEQEAIDFAVRGANRTITITSCNPDVLYNDHIQYLNKRFSFDFTKMSTNFEQIKLINENKRNKLFHYTNWHVNPYLSGDEIAQLEELRALDPDKAYCWYWGMPGAVSTSIFVKYIPKALTELTFTPNSFTAGMDLGQADSPTGHPTAVSLGAVGKGNGITRCYKVGELFHSNATMQYGDAFKIVDETILWLDAQYKKYHFRYLTVNVDYGAGGLTMIDLLNKRKRELLQNSNWLEFVPVDKTVGFVKDRVDFMQLAIVKGYCGFDWVSCPETLRQYNLIQGEEQQNKKNFQLKMLDINDDTFDSDCYALMPFMREIINQQDNRLLVKKMGGE